MPRAKNEVVPGYLVVRFREPGIEHIQRSRLLGRLCDTYCTLYHDADNRLWLIRVARGHERSEMKRIEKIYGVRSVAPLVLSHSAPRSWRLPPQVTAPRKPRKK